MPRVAGWSRTFAVCEARAVATVVRTPDLIGLGYEGLDVDGFCAALAERGVHTLVDVRLTPISRKRGFSKRVLAALLADRGIGYEHLPALGNPKDNRPGFYGDADAVEAARDQFRALLRTKGAQAALDRVVELCGNGRVALLCFEADEQRCHREVVLEQLAVRLDRPAVGVQRL